MYRFTAFIIICLSSQSIFANPSISKATLNEGAIEVLGSGFGSQNPMLFWDNVSSAYEAQGARSGDVVHTSSSDLWRQNTNQWGTPFTFRVSNDTRAGKSEPYYFGTGRANFVGSPNHSKPDRIRNEMYVSWWYKPSKSPSSEGGSNKFIRIWDDPNGEGTRISWTQMHLTCGNSTTWGSWNGRVNQWNHHAIHVNLNNKNIRTWVNGNLIHDGSCNKSSAHQDVPLYVGLVGFDHGSSSYDTMTTAIDDIYIASSQARVEISSDAKWSPTMAKEVLPVTSWTNSKIVAQPVYGKIKLSNEMYIYVVDEQGRVNSQGIRVDCQQCPKLVP